MLCQPFGRGHAVAALDQLRHLAPVDPLVEPHPDPALVADVGRHEEPSGIGADQDVLTAVRRLAPQRRLVGIGDMHAENLVAHAKRRLAPRFALLGLRQGEADRSEPVERRAFHGGDDKSLSERRCRARVPDGACRRVDFAGGRT